jgi:hypothetical protein
MANGSPTSRSSIKLIYATHHVGSRPQEEAKVLTKAFDQPPRASRPTANRSISLPTTMVRKICSVQSQAEKSLVRSAGVNVVLPPAKSGEIAAQITTPDFPSEIFTFPVES